MGRDTIEFGVVKVQIDGYLKNNVLIVPKFVLYFSLNQLMNKFSESSYWIGFGYINYDCIQKFRLY